MRKTKFKTPKDLLRTVLKEKRRMERERKNLSFEEKLKILVKLQEKAFFMGKTKFRPWPVS